MLISLPTFSSDESEDEQNSNIEQQLRPQCTLNRHNEAILNRQIAILEENPFTESYATIMRENFYVIIKIIEMACFSGSSIDSTWLTKCFKELGKNPNQLEDLNYCRKHILKYAQAAEYEAQLKLNSDKIISRQLLKIRLKVDEKYDTNSAKSRNLKKRTRVDSFENPLPSDDEFDPYLKRNEEIEDIFVKEPSPVIEPIPLASLANSSSNDDIQSLDNVSQAISIPIASIDKNKPKSNGPTKRQQIIQRITGNTYDSVPPNHVFGSRGRIRQNVKQNKVKQSTVNATKSHIHLDSAQTSRVAPAVPYQEKILSSSSDLEDSDLEDISPGSSNHTVQLVSSSSSSIQVIEIKKKSSMKSLNACFKKVNYDVNTVFSRVQLSTNPKFNKHRTITLTGQTTNVFTSTHRILASKENTQAISSESSTLYKKVPSSDYTIKISKRDNPLIKKPQEIADLKENIRREFMELLNKYYTFTYPSSRLFIVDSIMEPLDTDIFKNMCIFSLCYPRMPEWFLYALDRWWNDRQKHFYFTKVFILLGMDLIIYYADPNAKQEEVVINFLKSLLAWFEAKIKEIRKDIAFNLNKHTVCVMKNSENEDGISIKTEQYPFRLAQTPIFVIITVPEIGDWEVFFQGLNDRLRHFVNENRRYFTLLDWANILKKMKTDEVSTVEKRTAVLIKEMHHKHGVLYH